MPHHFRPFLFSDAERVLRDVANDQRLHQRIARQPITLLWWVLDEVRGSYLFGLDRQAMEGPGYLLRHAGHLFEVGVEPFGNRAAFFGKWKPISQSLPYLKHRAHLPKLSKFMAVGVKGILLHTSQKVYINQ